MLPDTVLAFDTSAAHCAAALLLPSGEVLIRSEEMTKGQAERLMPLLEELLAEAGLNWQALTLIAVGTGPGNFTGVRISVSAARGLALALGIPAIGVTALEALAYGSEGPLLVAQDARRGAAYLQAFGPEAPAQLGNAGELPEGFIAAPGTKVLGDLAEAYASAHGLLPAEPAASLVEATARLALARKAGDNPRPAPFYLRGADAAPPSDPPPVILDA